MKLANEHQQILDKIQELYREIFLHDGFGELKIEMKFLKKKQKEIIIRCGKDFRYVVDYDILPGSGGGPRPRDVMAGVNPMNP